MKIVILLCIVFALIGVTILFFYNNYPNSNYSYDVQIVAEKYAIGYYMATDAQLYAVEETIYDTKTDRYIVHLKEETTYESSHGTFILNDKKGELDKKIIIIGITDGMITSVDIGDET